MCVLIGPRKKNKPWVQAVKGTVIVTKTLCPGPRTPLEGRKTMPPGTFVKANQCRLLWALGLESTWAKQTYVSFPVEKPFLPVARTDKFLNTLLRLGVTFKKYLFTHSCCNPPSYLFIVGEIHLFLHCYRGSSTWRHDPGRWHVRKDMPWMALL